MNRKTVVLVMVCVLCGVMGPACIIHLAVGEMTKAVVATVYSAILGVAVARGTSWAMELRHKVAFWRKVADDQMAFINATMESLPGGRTKLAQCVESWDRVLKEREEVLRVVPAIHDDRAQQLAKIIAAWGPSQPRKDN